MPNQTASYSTQPVVPPPAPTPIPKPPPDVKAYLDRIVSGTSDKKFHLTGKGGDIGLTPFFYWPQKSTGPNSTSTKIDMRADNGTIYTIDFVTTGDKVSGIKVHRVNGEAVR